MSNETLTQNQVLANKLIAIKPNIISDDIKELNEKENISLSTIYMYLGGKVLNIETGITILKFFNKKVKARTATINNL